MTPALSSCVDYINGVAVLLSPLPHYLVLILPKQANRSRVFNSDFSTTQEGNGKWEHPLAIYTAPRCVSSRNLNQTSQKKMNSTMKLCAISFFLLFLFQKYHAQNATLDPSEGIPSSTISGFSLFSTQSV